MAHATKTQDFPAESLAVLTAPPPPPRTTARGYDHGPPHRCRVECL